MKKIHKYGVLSIILRNSVQYFKKSKGWGIIEQGVAFFRALSWTVGIIATQNLFDAVTDVYMKNQGFQKVVIHLGILAVVVIGQQVLSGIGQYLFKKVSYTNMGKFMVEFQQKLGRLPAVNFENTDFLNNVNKAKECLEYESLGHFASICLQTFTYYLVFFLSVGGYLFRLFPILPLIILIAFIPAVLGQLTQVKIFADLEEKNAPLRRRCEYYRKTITGREFYKETRMLGGFRFFHHLFTNALLNMTENTWKTEYKAAVLKILLNIISFVGLGVSILILFNTVMTGNISIGAFVSVFIALSQIFSIMDEIVSSHLSEGSETLGQVANYYQLMDMIEMEGKRETPDFNDGITASDVSFTYPNSNEAAINNIKLSIKKGETIAIVGENGSGKSTLVRLFIGLYTPDSGNIEIGGQNTKTTHPNSIFKNISGVFQHYQRYKMTLAENVAISNTKSSPEIEKIYIALREAEFNKNEITLETMLSPEFNGIDLSGGQWQRLAIARGLYRTNDFIVLDEPTAAIDPIEEAKLYNQFKQIVRNKCSIIVTHRLGSVKLADRIAVMNNGEIEDIGTHDELLLRKGKYVDMWKAQASWYENRTI